MVNRSLYDPALRDKSAAWLIFATSSFATLFFNEDSLLKWHGDLRIYATEQRYQELVDAGPAVSTRMQNGYRRVAVEGADLNDYRRQFDAWLGRSVE